MYFLITVLTLILSINATKSDLCQPVSSTTGSFLCAFTSQQTFYSIDLLDNQRTSLVGLPNWHRSYAFCCQMCNKGFENSQPCYGYNFFKAELICQLFSTRPYRFFENSDCIYSKINRKDCANFSQNTFNFKTVPDQLNFTCPIYSDFPYAVDSSKIPARINLALGRPVKVSSLLNFTNIKLCNGVDGNTNNVFQASSCVITDDGNYGYNWYMVDLQDIYLVLQVVISNRVENIDRIFLARLTGVYVGLLTVLPSQIIRGQYPLCAQCMSPIVNISKVILNCKYTKIGRYVLLQNTVVQDKLQLCEVEVFGNKPDCFAPEPVIIFTNSTYPDMKPLTCTVYSNYPYLVNPVSVNLALGRPVNASSMLPDSFNNICNAVDGNANANFGAGRSCIITDYASIVGICWLIVDLQDIYRVDRVIVSNRLDTNTYSLAYLTVGLLRRFYGIVERYTYPICNQFLDASIGIAKLEFICIETIGRFVLVQGDYQTLAIFLCEVEAYGATVTGYEKFGIYFNNLTYPDNISLSCNLYPGYPNISYPIRPNLALGRPVFYSSKNPISITNGCNVVDGNGNGIYSVGSCFQTNDLVYNWIAVDLQDIYRLDKFVLTNTAGPTYDQTLDYVIAAVATQLPAVTLARGSYLMCGQYPSPSIKAVKIIIECTDQDTIGRYAILQAGQTTYAMVVCELEIFGVLRSKATMKTPTFNSRTYPENAPFNCPMSSSYPLIRSPVPVNIALGRQAYQSSTYNDGWSHPCHATDGNGEQLYQLGGCTAVPGVAGTNGWIAVDLARNYSISYVIISNRQDDVSSRLSNCYVGVLSYLNTASLLDRNSYPLCGRFPGSSSLKLKLKVTCSSSTPPGRFVVVQEDVTYVDLCICEIEVYGELVV